MGNNKNQSNWQSEKHWLFHTNDKQKTKGEVNAESKKKNTKNTKKREEQPGELLVKLQESHTPQKCESIMTIIAQQDKWW